MYFMGIFLYRIDVIGTGGNVPWHGERRREKKAEAARQRVPTTPFGSVSLIDLFCWT
jgi:hypothetical protein